MSRRVQDNQNSQGMQYQKIEQMNMIKSFDALNKNESSITFRDNDFIKTLPTQEYLNSTIIHELSEGMFQVSQAKPTNPIEFLGKFLLEQSRLRKQENYR